SRLPWGTCDSDPGNEGSHSFFRGRIVSIGLPHSVRDILKRCLFPSNSESESRPDIQTRRRIAGHILIMFVQQILQVGISGNEMVEPPPSAYVEPGIAGGVILRGHAAA